MFLAEEAATGSTSNFDVFDLFIIAFTIIIFIGVVRSLTARKKNKLAIAFGLISLAVFLFMDYVMIKNWMGLL